MLLSIEEPFPLLLLYHVLNTIANSIRCRELPLLSDYGILSADGFMSIDRRKLAVIHIMKQELNLSDSEYRGIVPWRGAGMRLIWTISSIRSIINPTL